MSLNIPKDAKIYNGFFVWEEADGLHISDVCVPDNLSGKATKMASNLPEDCDWDKYWDLHKRIWDAGAEKAKKLYLTESRH